MKQQQLLELGQSQLYFPEGLRGKEATPLVLAYSQQLFVMTFLGSDP